MNTLHKDKVAGTLGVVTGVAGVVLLAAIVSAADPMGWSIGALIGASIAVGCIGTLFRGPNFEGSIYRGPRPHPVPQSYPTGPTAVATLYAADSTAWNCDDNDAEFAPVVSLTEAQVARRRPERERREAASAQA
jgi:hypothetical protein